MQISSKTSVDELLKLSIESAKDVEKEKEFKVKDLFRGIDWNCLSLSTRNRLGRRFLEYVEKNGGFVPIGKTLKNQQKYKKL